MIRATRKNGLRACSEFRTGPGRGSKKAVTSGWTGRASYHEAMAIEIHLPPGARSAPPAAVTSTSNLHRSRASQTRKPQTTPLESPARPQWSRDDDPLDVGLISLSVRCRSRRHLARPGLLENGQEISWVRQPSVVVSRLAACHCVPNASQARRERALCDGTAKLKL